MVDLLVVESMDGSIGIGLGAYIRRSRRSLFLKEPGQLVCGAGMHKRSVYSRRTRLRNILSGYTYVRWYGRLRRYEYVGAPSQCSHTTAFNGRDQQTVNIVMHVLLAREAAIAAIYCQQLLLQEIICW